MWVLDGGRHLVACGSSTRSRDVEALLAGDLVDLVWTDPPYGVSYVGGTKDRLTIKGDDLSADALRRDLLEPAFTQMAQVLRPGGAFYVCSPSGPLEATFRGALDAVNLTLRQQLVWAKDRFVLGHQDYHQRHESILFGWGDGDAPLEPPLYDPVHDTILYGWAPGAAHTWEGGRKQDTVWECPRPKASRLHPTMKPVELVSRAMENSSRPGDLVADFFGGSGSLLIAAYTLSRRSRTMELDPAYVDVICRRWQQHTGMVPVRAADGAEVSFVEG